MRISLFYTFPAFLPFLAQYGSYGLKPSSAQTGISPLFLVIPDQKVKKPRPIPY